MSKTKIKISSDEAFKKLDQQIKKGSSLIDEGSENFKKSMGRDRRVDDNFENKYKMWLNITAEMLDGIFSSTDYSWEFKERISSQTEYVSSDWKPDIKYWITKELIPKIDYLVILRESINDFEFDDTLNEELNSSPKDIVETDNYSSIDMDSKNNINEKSKKTGRTFWDVLIDFWRPTLIIISIVLAIIILLAIFKIIRLGYNEGFYFEIGTSYLSDDTLNGIEFTHLINLSHTDKYINLRSRALKQTELNEVSLDVNNHNETIIAQLNNGHKVYLIGKTNGCYEIIVKVNDKIFRGFISSKIYDKDTLISL